MSINAYNRLKSQLHHIVNNSERVKIIHYYLPICLSLIASTFNVCPCTKPYAIPFVNFRYSGGPSPAL